MGFLHAPVSFEIIRSRYTTLARLETEGLNQFFADMIAEAEAVVRAGAPGQPLQQRHVAFMRYHGQGHEIEIALPVRALEAGDLDGLQSAFETEYIRQFSRAVPGMTIEILNWAVSVSSGSPELSCVSDTPVTYQRTSDETREILCDVTGTLRPAAVYERADLHPGDWINGPALVIEPQSTTLVSANFTARPLTQLSANGRL